MFRRAFEMFQELIFGKARRLEMNNVVTMFTAGVYACDCEEDSIECNGPRQRNFPAVALLPTINSIIIIMPAFHSGRSGAL